MSRNPGNTGRRYRMPQIISVRDEDRHVVLNLGCGHEKVIGVNETVWRPTSWDARAFWHGQVGQRERCYECAEKPLEVPTKRQITRPDIECEIEAKGIGPEDAFHIREFATFLAMAGPARPMSKARAARIRKRFGDAYLGLKQAAAHEADPQKRYASEYLTDLVASLIGVEFSAADQKRINKPLKAARDYLGFPE